MNAQINESPHHMLRWAPQQQPQFQADSHPPTEVYATIAEAKLPLPSGFQTWNTDLTALSPTGYSSSLQEEADDDANIPQGAQITVELHQGQPVRYEFPWYDHTNPETDWQGVYKHAPTYTVDISHFKAPPSAPTSNSHPNSAQITIISADTTHFDSVNFAPARGTTLRAGSTHCQLPADQVVAVDQHYRRTIGSRTPTTTAATTTTTVATTSAPSSTETETRPPHHQAQDTTSPDYYVVQVDNSININIKVDNPPLDFGGIVAANPHHFLALYALSIYPAFAFVDTAPPYNGTENVFGAQLHAISPTIPLFIITVVPVGFKFQHNPLPHARDDPPNFPFTIVSKEAQAKLYQPFASFHLNNNPSSTKPGYYDDRGDDDDEDPSAAVQSPIDVEHHRTILLQHLLHTEQTLTQDPESTFKVQFAVPKRVVYHIVVEGLAGYFDALPFLNQWSLAHWANQGLAADAVEVIVE